MPEHQLIIPLVVPQFFTAPDDEKNIGSDLDADVFTNVKAPPSIDEYVDEDDKRSYLYPSREMLQTLQLLGGFIKSDSITLAKVFIDLLRLQHVSPHKAHTNHFFFPTGVQTLHSSTMIFFVLQYLYFALT